MEMRYNYFPDPMGTGEFVRPKLLDCVRVAPNWGTDKKGFALVTSETGVGAFAQWETPKMPEGARMRFICDVGTHSSTDTFRGRFVSITTLSDVVLAETPENVPSESTVKLNFTVPSDGKVLVKFRGRTAAGMMTGFYLVRIIPDGQPEDFFYWGSWPLRNENV